MNEEPKPTAVPPEPPQRVQSPLTEVEYLRQIADHLKSIRSMLGFFTAIVILAFVLQACGVISSLLGG